MMGVLHKNSMKIKCPICNGQYAVKEPLTAASIDQQLLTNRAAIPGQQEEEKKVRAEPILAPEVLEAEERSATEEFERLVGRITPVKVSYASPVLAHILVYLLFFTGIAARVYYVTQASQT
eukprot:TRINITY_DN10421_c0_g2_i5.p4 TRINITY_DN10421_c0_g2~~TRINITY_DN10421_c0_g2_i5.p4  ORF type:complete len:121 (-),score=34.79 TRINITY_DN10421_c0_g2_i5:650-1012(-)